MEVKWLDEPEAHDYDAAADYLSLLGEHGAVDKTVAALRGAEPVFRMAKDILRAADRVCASYVTDENTSIPCRLVS